MESVFLKVSEAVSSTAATTVRVCGKTTSVPAFGVRGTCGATIEVSGAPPELVALPENTAVMVTGALSGGCIAHSASDVLGSFDLKLFEDAVVLSKRFPDLFA